MLVLNFMLSLMTSFKPFFNLGENDIVADAICYQFFESNQNIYTEDGISVNGEWIYSPHPLDEVWLSEPEHQDRRGKMEAQHCQHEECQCIQVHNTPTPATPVNSSEIEALSGDDSTVDSSPHDEMS